MKPPINSVKHIVQKSLTSTSGIGELLVSTIALAVEGAPTLANQVPIGSLIKAVYVEIWTLATAQQPTTTNVTVEKIESGASVMTFNESQDLHSYSNKKNIFMTHQGLVGDANSNPTPQIREWIKIPKGKQRMGLGDALNINVSGITEEIQICGVFIFKSYT